MANETGYSSIIRDALTGNSVGLDTWADVLPGNARDILTGDRYGILLLADGYHTSREQLTGDRYGLDVYGDALPGNAREILTGDGFGMTWLSSGVQIVREAIIMEPPYKVAAASREVLVSLPDDPLTVARVITSYRQAVLMVRPTMALPSTVKSPQIVPTLRMQAIQQHARPWAVSDKFASTLRMQAVQHRFFTPAPQVWSANPVSTLGQQVVQSRGQVYVAVSEVRVKTEQQQITQRRDFTPAPQIRTAITARTLVQQYIASRATHAVVITTTADVGSHAEQVVQASGRPAPRSEIDGSTLVQMIVQKHNIVPPGIDDRAATLGQQAVQVRPLTPPFGDEHVGEISEQVVQRRDYGPQRSYNIVPGYVQQTVMHRDTYTPANVIGRHVYTMAQQTTAAITLPMHHSLTTVGMLALRFVLGRTTPAPWDVIDPAIGRHTAKLSHLTVMHRDTIPPHTIATESRYAYNVLGQVVVGDNVFPAPPLPVQDHETDVIAVHEWVTHGDNAGWSAVSAVTAQQVIGQAVVTDNDGWIDATVPQSEVRVTEAWEIVTVGDTEFPGSMVSQSAALVAGLVESVALGDTTLPDPMIPQSVAQVAAVTEFAALGDAQFPNPLIPLSEVRSSLVGAVLALGDPSLQGQFAMSEIQGFNLAEFVVITDKSLVGIPLRGGPRPIVSVSMS